ncbi:hypothetical protein ACP70R_015360 [Stipagrostis hirtigluma subsp. patula]
MPCLVYVSPPPPPPLNIDNRSTLQAILIIRNPSDQENCMYRRRSRIRRFVNVVLWWRRTTRAACTRCTASTSPSISSTRPPPTHKPQQTHARTTAMAARVSHGAASTMPALQVPMGHRPISFSIAGAGAGEEENESLYVMRDTLETKPVQVDGTPALSSDAAPAERNFEVLDLDRIHGGWRPLPSPPIRRPRHSVQHERIDGTWLPILAHHGYVFI